METALTLARNESFDIVIGDIGPPDATGYELLNRILNIVPPIQGIAMSGYGMEEDIRKSRKAGFDEHLVKPVDITQLERTLRRVTTRAANHSGQAGPAGMSAVVKHRQDSDAHEILPAPFPHDG